MGIFEIVDLFEIIDLKVPCRPVLRLDGISK